MKKTLSVAVAVLALASFSNAGQAAESKNKEAAKAAPAKAAAQPAKPTPEQIANIKRAGTILRSFNFAMSSKEVPDAVLKPIRWLRFGAHKSNRKRSNKSTREWWSWTRRIPTFAGSG